MESENSAQQRRDRQNRQAGQASKTNEAVTGRAEGEAAADDFIATKAKEKVGGVDPDEPKAPDLTGLDIVARSNATREFRAKQAAYNAKKNASQTQALK